MLHSINATFAYIKLNYAIYLITLVIAISIKRISKWIVLVFLVPFMYTIESSLKIHLLMEYELRK